MSLGSFSEPQFSSSTHCPSRFSLIKRRIFQRSRHSASHLKLLLPNTAQHSSRAAWLPSNFFVHGLISLLFPATHSSHHQNLKSQRSRPRALTPNKSIPTPLQAFVITPATLARSRQSPPENHTQIRHHQAPRPIRPKIRAPSSQLNVSHRQHRQLEISPARRLPTNHRNQRLHPTTLRMSRRISARPLRNQASRPRSAGPRRR